MSEKQLRDTSAKAPGSHSRTEILSQPACWGQCLDELAPQIPQVLKQFAEKKEWLFIGCGSSYYIALAAAAFWASTTGMRARAVPAGDLLLFPEQILAGSGDVVPVLISRSGFTSEVLRAGELLEKQKGIRCLAITCGAQPPLAEVASATLWLRTADEQSTVMTRSFTSMLMGLQYLGASAASNREFVSFMQAVRERAAGFLTSADKQIRDFVATREFADYVCLGQGPLYGLACEGALKVTEMSVSYAQSFHTLEFRHGPKSIVSPETLVVCLLSESGGEAEVEVLEEVKRLGGATLAVGNRVDQRIRAASDLALEIGAGVPEPVRTVAYAFAGQLLGLYTGLKKGLDPDNPRNLSRVVILDQDDSSQPSEHATI